MAAGSGRGFIGSEGRGGALDQGGLRDPDLIGPTGWIRSRFHIQFGQLFYKQPRTVVWKVGERSFGSGCSTYGK